MLDATNKTDGFLVWARRKPQRYRVVSRGLATRPGPKRRGFMLQMASNTALEQPRLPGAELHGDLRDCYKIKLLRQGYRLVYQVRDDVLVVLVLAVSQREDMKVYRAAVERLLKKHHG